jgi:hypothetical protein
MITVSLNLGREGGEWQIALYGLSGNSAEVSR